MPRRSSEKRRQIYDEFRQRVNMAPKALERWLATGESQAVGVKQDDGGESIGHASGRRIVQIKRTKKQDLSDGDYDHMVKVVKYVKRHSAQGPAHDAEHSRWRYSLMNWGHDPLAE